MYRLTKGSIYRDQFEIPYNDGPVAEYCFLSVLSETGDARALRAAVLAQGATPVGKVTPVKADRKYRSRRTVQVARYLETSERTTQWGSDVAVAYAWVKVPELGWADGAPVREAIGPLSEEQVEDWHQSGCEYAIGVASSDGTIAEYDDANGPVIMSGWEFYHILPLLGYTWQSYLIHSGHTPDADGDVTPYGFEDDSDVCSECCTLDSRDDGYTYNFRETPGGNYVGVNCGCYDAACEDEYLDGANESDKSITLDLARKLAGQGKLTFVARYIGGWTDPGRGGHFWDHSQDQGNLPDAAGFGRVENGDPAEVLTKLLETDPDGMYVISHDESGQFQTYWSIWRVVDEVEGEVA